MTNLSPGPFKPNFFPMKLILALIVLHSFCFQASAQNLNIQKLSIVNRFINLVKNNQKGKLSSAVLYPIERKYPLAKITDAKSFVLRYNDIFDPNLIGIITRSDPKKDWTVLGSQGIMLLDGILWLDIDGKLKSINYHSDKELNQSQKLINDEKSNLHASLSKFREPKLKMSTKQFSIRIDDLGNGNYRYASWPRGISEKKKPDLIITHGKLIPDGSGGNYKYTFKNGTYTYECRISPLKEDDSSVAFVSVFKEGHRILNQAAVL